jgi:hypothetical protein
VVVEARPGPFDVGQRDGGPVQECVDEVLQRLPECRDAVLDGDGPRARDDAIDHPVALQAPECRRERLLRHDGDRPAEVVEAQRPLAQGVEDLERPFVEHLVEQLAVLLGELRSGFRHDT